MRSADDPHPASASVVAEARVPRTRTREGDVLTAAIVGLLILTWCIEGALELTGLPHRVSVAVDASEVLLCLGVGIWLLRARTIPRIPVLVTLYVLWVLAGLATNAPAGAVVTALRNFVLLPALAFFLAVQGTTERRARTVAAVLLGLATLEVAVTIAQALRFADTDKIVGTFGRSANAATAAAVLIAVCVGAAGFLVRAPFATAGLAAVTILPLFAAWASVKLVPLLLPVAVGAVALSALARRRTTMPHAAAAMAAAALSTGLIVGYYAAFRPDSFAALFHAHARSNYLRNASISPTAPRAGRPVPGRLTQWRMARHEISGSLRTEAFGKGLGTATVAENVGVYPKDLSPDAEAASYSDFGTLLVERGWLGIAIVGALAIALAWTSFRILAVVPEHLWTTAFTAAVPGAVCVIAAYGPLAEQLRNAGAALTFWLVVALGLSPGSFLARRARTANARRSELS